MALSSGSSVSEDVWTLIKMCRASGRVPLLSFILSFSLSLPLSSSPFAAFHPSRARARERLDCALGVATFGAGNVTWMAAAVVVVVFCTRREIVSPPCVVTSCQQPTDRPTERTNRQSALRNANMWLCFSTMLDSPYCALFAKTKRARGQRGRSASIWEFCGPSTAE